MMVDLRRRATDPELLDEGVSEAEAVRSLGDLRLVNRWLGGRRSILGAVRPLINGNARLTLLDVGCGSADLPHELVRSSGSRLLAVGLDQKLVHVRQAPDDVERVVGDVRRLPFGPRSFDVVTASLFLHHFDGSEVAQVLAGLYALCRRGLVVNDLHRARVPYVFGRAVFPWVFRSPVSVTDGLISIRRAFRPDELRRAFEDAGIPHVRIRRRFPYRIVAVAERTT
jgi:ubiquinone/menaquinone biosynthesis C-methylase UbiE